ncbi:MAG: sensor domain-containing diguanylate cyclase [Actinomycetia bacterium]|nr:sensor domain-containing diguanylate cyclase [Actinomycetes bacterium]
MKNLADNGDRVKATATSPRGAPTVEAEHGPLIGDRRLQRALPFAATAIIAMAIAVPTASWTQPDMAVFGLVLVAVTLAGSAVLPWHRVPRQAQLAPPFLLLIGALLLASSTGSGIGSPFITLSVLPLMWLAIYENQAAVLIAAAVAGVVLWLGAHGHNSAPATGGVAPTAVLIVCCAGMGMTLHGLVARSRKLTSEVAVNQVSLERSATVLNALPELVNRYRMSDHVITYCNAAWAAQYEVTQEAAVGRRLDDFLSEDEKDGLRSQLAILGPDNPILVDHVARVAGHDSGEKWLEWMDRYITGVDGPEVLSIGRDVTRRKVAEMELAQSETRFRQLADKSADVVWRFTTQPTPHFEYMSPSVENILGYPPSYFLEDFSRMMDILDDVGRTAIARALNGEQILDRFDFRFRHADGSTVVGETRTSPIRDGLQGVSRDVTELRNLQDNMAALALRDSLTGLANRRLFSELLDAALARTKRSGRPLALAFLDLDGFKTVNDVHGHDVGDRVLCETADRLLRVVRGADTIARLGGDEFVIVYEPNDANSHQLIERIEHALSRPILIEPNIEVVCPASIGVANTDAVGYDGTALLAAADEAMYEEKRARHALRSAGDSTVETRESSLSA